ncbi:DUF6894 family protein [Bradyrhizobium valentinum]|uniref:DUF6894 domain-containing protein n=1 Tax=Bradyrhizobium valentinum TaxID=1518501 RepID=A0A0R3M1K1_9BRAD|nr:hypothetical protein [Bradyrhizobium valentinum]KRR02058.1 hypothetical protein CP49_04545 [Bradyrhizobium valentinum]KRR13916.1 hypothetical protein CQ10_38330 [Bradyrhizobium valentinum]
MQQHLKCGSKIDLELQDLFDGTTRESPMKRYYFDIRDGSQFIRDDEGAELPNIDSAREEATTALSEMAREWVRGRPQHRISVEVRDDHGPILEASFSFVMKPCAT